MPVNSVPVTGVKLRIQPQVMLGYAQQVALNLDRHFAAMQLLRRGYLT